jgi:heme A synthase
MNEDSSTIKSVRERRFAAYAWTTLAGNMLVVLWGAYVRATGSGAGCGGHWPLCNGVVLPRQPAVETIIELTHRLSSGLALILVVILFLFARRIYEKGTRVRTLTTVAVILVQDSCCSSLLPGIHPLYGRRPGQLTSSILSCSWPHSD